MTIESLREHEARGLELYKDDFRRKAIEELALSHVMGRRVLDMRCFRGNLPVELAIRGFEVVALDGFKEAVEMTNALAASRGIRQPVARLWDFVDLEEHVETKRFETVICMDILNHVRDDGKLMEEISRVLVQNGRLILLVPAFPSLRGKRDEGLGHLRRYTRGRLRELLQENGLILRSMHYWNFAPLAFYILLEKIFKVGVSDRLRHAGRDLFGPLPNRMLGWWYRTIENKRVFPCGLSLFAIAHKVSDSPSMTSSVG